MYLKREVWGYSIWQNRKQIAAGVGLTPEAFHSEFDYSTRVWRKHGIARLK